MAEISAKQVHALRAKTDLAMMDCKKALVEADGDEAKALEILRKRFADKMTERAERETANGRIGVYGGPEGAAMVELRCETDFVATNSDFRSLADSLAEHCVKSGITDVEKFKTSKMATGRTVQETLVDAFGRMKENLNLVRLVRLDGYGASYVHHNGRIGTIITADKSPGDAGRGICMHIASTPTLLGRVREDVDSKQVAEARERSMTEAKGKPEPILNKIVEGKMDKWYGERVLVEQPFVMDDKKTVGQFAKENGFEIKSYLKFEVGVIG
ncbi:MAG TPA: translation elongation factor Ts [Phycisphaerae bacterium]|nr:translation elongation factor Ts [Phycisphaerae bacterium]